MKDIKYEDLKNKTLDEKLKIYWLRMNMLESKIEMLTNVAIDMSALSKMRSIKTEYDDIKIPTSA